MIGRCTALRVFILRRRGRSQNGLGCLAASEDASYFELGSFIRSVQGTLEKFVFEHAGDWLPSSDFPLEIHESFEIMNLNFHYFIVPEILSGNWPCLTIMELRGVLDPIGSIRNMALIMRLNADLGPKVNIFTSRIRYVHICREPCRWN